jgi:hypothetical protein
MTSADLDTLYLALPVGADNGTTMLRLAHFLDWSDRKVRKGVQLLRRERHVKVVALTTDKGCFIARDEDLDALKHNADAMHSRAMSVLVTEKDLREMIADIEWNPALFAVN